jgi:hypothetical protein
MVVSAEQQLPADPDRGETVSRRSVQRQPNLRHHEARHDRCRALPGSCFDGIRILAEALASSIERDVFRKELTRLCGLKILSRIDP